MNRKLANNFSWLIVWSLAALAGCSDEAERRHGYGLQAMHDGSESTATMEMAAAPSSTAAPRTAARSLAYEHSVSVQTTKQALTARLRQIEQACTADQTHGCTILDVTHHARDALPSGSIRMRLAPEGVEPMIAIAAKDGTVIGRNTRAEDLADPVADVERRLALLNIHRDRLTKFMESKELKFEQLIVVSKELADVQSQIDAFSTDRNNLRRRIDTHLLSISLTLPPSQYAATDSPISEALGYFGADFRRAVASIIRFIAVLLPWLVIVLPGLYLLRLFWRWIGQRMARRESA